MKRMLLVFEVEEPEGVEIDEEAIADILDELGFVDEVETEEGALTALPLNTYYGEFDDDVDADSLSDKLEAALEKEGLEVSALLITQMGDDQVLIGPEMEEGEEGDEDLDEEGEDEDEDEEEDGEDA